MKKRNQPQENTTKTRTLVRKGMSYEESEFAAQNLKHEKLSEISFGSYFKFSSAGEVYEALELSSIGRNVKRLSDRKMFWIVFNQYDILVITGDFGENLLLF